MQTLKLPEVNSLKTTPRGTTDFPLFLRGILFPGMQTGLRFPHLHLLIQLTNIYWAPNVYRVPVLTCFLCCDSDHPHEVSVIIASILHMRQRSWELAHCCTAGQRQNRSLSPGSLTSEPVYSVRRADDLARRGDIQQQRDGEVSCDMAILCNAVP